MSNLPSIPPSANSLAYPGVFQQSYSPGVYVGIILGTIYCGIFVMLNNHYVFKPKVQRLVSKLKTKSRSGQAIKQMLIDVVTSLSICTFCMSSLFLSGSTNCIEMYLVSDGIWMGVYASVILYRGRNQEKGIQWKYAVKNSLALMLCYGTLVVHFALDYYYVTFGVVLLVLYLVNQITNIYFDRIQEYISNQFLRSEEVDLPSIDHLLTPKSLYPDLETLAQFYKCDEREFEDMNAKYCNKRNSMKLKSKALIYQKLHDIFLEVNLSYRKYKRSEDRKTVMYIGRLNGTISLEKQRNYNNSDVRQITKRTNHITQNNNRPQSGDQQPCPQQLPQVQQNPHDCLLYVFPIRILQYSPTISSLFSIGLNLCYGVFLDYSLQVLRKLHIGNIFSCILVFTILPVIPNTNISQLHNSMTLGSVFKYGFTGLALLAKCLYTDFTVHWVMTDPMIYVAGLQLGYCLYYCVIVLVVRWQEYKFLTLCFLGVFGAHLYLSHSFVGYFN